MKNQTNFTSLFFFFFFFVFSMGLSLKMVMAQNKTAFLHVGVVLDSETWVGKTSLSCISMALQDFYDIHKNYTTRLLLHVRDSKQDVVAAADAALDLMKNEAAKAIIGPQNSDQAAFMVHLGDKAHVPILSFSATSLSISSKQSPYFIRTAYNDSSQCRAIASIAQAFGWLEVTFIYEDSNYGNGILPCLTQAFHETNPHIPHKSALSPSAADEQILTQLYKLMNTSSRVFIVHASQSLGSQISLKAKEAGMMSKGSAWIITDGLANLLDVMDSSVIESMQGVLGVIPYVPKSKELDNFTVRWKRQFRWMNPTVEKVELSVYGLWAYDTVWALAMAAERVGATSLKNQMPLESSDNSRSQIVIEVSQLGLEIRDAILTTEIKRGLSGEFHLVDGQLQSSVFQIVNVVGKAAREIGYWTPTHGISKEPYTTSNKTYSTSIDDLRIRLIVWPGEVTTVPQGSFMSTMNKLRIGVPLTIHKELVNFTKDPQTNSTKFEGFCIDVFRSAMDALPFKIPYEFIPIEGYKWQKVKGKRMYNNELVYRFHLQGDGEQGYDALVGTIRMTYNRSKYADFTLPYSGSGVSMIAPFKGDVRKDTWIFLKPLSLDLWVTSGAAFIFTGFVVWVLEHQINEAFTGRPSQQLGTVLWFSFSTLVYAHRENVINNLSRFVVIIWLFVVLVLSSGYTASLSSMLTVQSLLPSVISKEQLIKNGDYVGYDPDSGVDKVLKNLNFAESKIKPAEYENWDKDMTRGSRHGGVSAIFADIIFTKSFLRKHCDKYIMVGPTYRAGQGYAFAFQKGSPLVPYISEVIMNLTDEGKILELEKKWLDSETCESQGISEESLSLVSFKGLFLVTGVASVSALLLHLLHFLYKQRHILLNSARPVSQRLASMGRHFNDYNGSISSSSKRTQHGQG